MVRWYNPTLVRIALIAISVVASLAVGSGAEVKACCEGWGGP